MMFFPAAIFQGVLFYILSPALSLAIYLIVKACTESLSPCDVPDGADWCYICDAEQRQGTCCASCGDCNDYGGCWCGDDTYDYWFCAETDYTATVIFAVFGSIVSIPVIAAVIVVICSRCGCCKQSDDSSESKTAPLMETETEITEQPL